MCSENTSSPEFKVSKTKLYYITCSASFTLVIGKGTSSAAVKNYTVQNEDKLNSSHTFYFINKSLSTALLQVSKNQCKNNLMMIITDSCTFLQTKQFLEKIERKKSPVLKCLVNRNMKLQVGKACGKIDFTSSYKNKNSCYERNSF